MRRIAYLIVIPLLGCITYIRDPENLEIEVVELVEEREEALSNCYDEQLAKAQFDIELTERKKQGPYADIGPAVTEQVSRLNGTVVLSFFIDKKTGNFSRLTVEPTSTAAPPLVQCVVNTLQTLKLDPADQRTGKVTLAWDFKVGKHQGLRPTEFDLKKRANSVSNRIAKDAV